MFNIMLISHLLGDYLFQFDFIARWKSRSIWGVIAHGGLVTLITLLCAILVDLSWWPYALFIGITHTLIDIVRARLIQTKDTTMDLFWFLLDQSAHITIITLVVWFAKHFSAMRGFGQGLSPRILAIAIGYLMLLQPGWVFLRFIVRGLWGADAAPDLSTGEKFEPMVERVLITSCVLLGQLYFIPVILLPRRLTFVHIQNNGVGMLMKLTTHWAETLLGVSLAISVGLVLKMLLI